jgi:hypothetical protein
MSSVYRVRKFEHLYSCYLGMKRSNFVVAVMIDYRLGSRSVFLVLRKYAHNQYQVVIVTNSPQSWELERLPASAPSCIARQKLCGSTDPIYRLGCCLFA